MQCSLSPIELAFRSMLGHKLGRIDPLAHLQSEYLGPVARQAGSDTEPSPTYVRWLKRHQKELALSREDFVAHHKQKCGGQIPVRSMVRRRHTVGTTSSQHGSTLRTIVRCFPEPGLEVQRHEPPRPFGCHR